MPSVPGIWPRHWARPRLSESSAAGRAARWLRQQAEGDCGRVALAPPELDGGLAAGVGIVACPAGDGPLERVGRLDPGNIALALRHDERRRILRGVPAAERGGPAPTHDP